MSVGQRIATGIKATFAARILNTAANGLLLLLLTRYLLSPDQYGSLYFAIAVVGVAELLGTLGVVKSTARYVTEYLEDDPTQVRYLLSRSLAIVSTVSIAVSIVISLGSTHLAELLGQPDLAPLLLVGGFYVAGRSMKEYLIFAFQSFNRVAYSALVGTVNSVVRLLVAVGLVVLGFGAVGVMAGYIAGFAVAAVVGVSALYLRFYVDLPATETVEPGLLRRVLEYSVPTAATRASSIVDSRVDTVLVGLLATPTAVAFYTLGRQVSNLCVVPAESLGFTISPTLGEQSAAENPDLAATIYQTSLENVLLFYVPAATGLAIVAHPMVRYVFGPDYLGAALVIQLFALYIVVRAIHKITGSGLDYLGLARIRAIARGVSAAGNVALNLVLIPQYGAAGAAAATVLTFSSYTFVNIYYLARELPMDWGDLFHSFTRIVAIAAVMGVAVVAATTQIEGILTLAATVALGGAIWAGLSVVTGLVEPRRIWTFLT
jgi:O-antigen/teichoic acid export membrane protein